MAKKKPTPKSSPPAKPTSGLPVGYSEFLDDLKSRIRLAQIKAALSVNRELTALYWHIGRMLVERQQTAKWGTKVIDRLATDLQQEFPGTTGFSRQNVYRMRAFYLAYSDRGSIVSQAARQLTDTPPEPAASLPWFHNVTLVEQVKDPKARAWYAQAVIEFGWSRPVLVHQIETDLYARQGKAVTNFERTLPPSQSDLAREALKDPYAFDFLELAAEHQERELETGLLAHIRRFLLELGAGFAFVGQQVPLEVGGEDFIIDLLFYHLKLRAYVVIDLKAVPFKPEFGGKMNFYLSAVDDLMRHPDDKPSIGIILCKSRNEVVAEYALRDLVKPVGVATYVTKLVESLPPAFRDQLPNTKQLRAALEEGGDESGRKKPPINPD
jgi:predicted nuclease of restriction endonuclease-like (RecB) superfamily